MAVETPQIKIDPYTSTVPLVQVPQQDYEQPQQAPRVYSRKAGIAELGDDVFRGLMRGLEVKEQRKHEQAQATVNALDKRTQDAYNNYQTALATGKKEQADAAYGVYLNSFNAAKQAKAQFVIPEKRSHHKGGQKKKDEEGVSTGGFGAGLKQFFERNPHIIPEISLLAMQPKPPGPSVQTVGEQQQIQAGENAQKEQQQRLAEETRKQSAEKIYDELGQKPLDSLSEDEKAKLNWSRDILFPQHYGHTMYTYKVPKAGGGFTYEKLLPDDAAQMGAELVVPGQEQKLGTVGDFLSTVAADNKTSAENLNAGQKGYLEKLWHFYQQNPSASTATSWWLDKDGNWQTRTAPNYRGPVPPKPPAGLFPSTFVLPGAKGGGGRSLSSAPTEKTLNPYKNPEQQPPEQSYAFNKQWAKTGPYVTTLSPGDEQKFQQWVQANHIPWQDTPTADYDMRGYWKAMQSGNSLAKRASNGHFPDKWKTPYSGTFSRESMYATSDAPYWKGDNLVTNDGRLVTGETASRGQGTPSRPASGKMTAPPGRQPMRAWQATQDTQKVETEKANRYRAAEQKYEKAIQAARVNFGKVKDPAIFEAQKKEAAQQLASDKSEIQKWYDQQVHAVGGSTEPQPPSGATMVYRDKDGAVKGWAVNGEFVPVGKQ